MADPLSIIAGTVGIIDVCVRLVEFLHDVKKSVANVNAEIQALLDEVESLKGINESIASSYSDWRQTAKGPPATAARIESYWKKLDVSLQGCTKIISKLEAVLRDIHRGSGSKTTSALETFSKEKRRRSKNDDLRRLRDQLASYQRGLHILLQMILFETQGLASKSVESLVNEVKELRKLLASQVSSLHSSPPAPPYSDSEDLTDTFATDQLQQLGDSIFSAANLLATASGNKHFDVPQPLSSLYTGRQSLLGELKHIFFPLKSDLSQRQKRFVINGIGGSGKTQFCSKFAAENRELYWGVFWLDARSSEGLQQTFSVIAKIAEIEPNETAVLYWLSNLGERWLLIIDNADDPQLDVSRLFPKGDRGHILVTTRNPLCTTHGNIGPKYFEFEGLDEVDASELLLKAADQTPDPSSCIIAKRISKALGFLALAITNAGAAIRSHLCTFKNYLATYKEYWERVRRDRLPPSVTPGETSQSDYMKIWASFELSYAKIEAQNTQSSNDAIQLLKVLAFFYCENIRVDILLKAVTNLKLEQDQAGNEDVRQKNLHQSVELPKQSWSQTCWNTWRTANLLLLGCLFQERGPCLLPHFLWESRDRGVLDEFRLRAAFRQLVSTSLVIHKKSNDSYSLHPLISEWARERPEAALSEHDFLSQQYLRARSASMIIAASILLPPLGETEDDEGEPVKF
ncbi:MAG: hypothetical protein Q9227_005699 [Pyrenula ochraceoflavens]